MQECQWPTSVGFRAGSVGSLTRVASESIRKTSHRKFDLLAGRLGSAAREDVLQVRHPSLPDYERGEVAHLVLRRDGQVVRAGAMVTFTVTGGDQRALRVMPAVEIGCEATSLGGVETLVSTPFNSSHFSVTPEERRAARIDDGMVRVSCGVEPGDLLVADLLRALDATA